MTVFSNTGGGYLAGKLVFPMDYAAEVSQRLVDACHANDVNLALECINDPFVDVDFVGTVFLRSRKTEVVLHGESAHEVRVEFEEFKTEVTAIFLAAHNGNLNLVRKLLNLGANVNRKLFRGYATTAAVREGHIEILEILLNAGAAQPAREDALIEASYLGRARPAELLMSPDMVRPHVAVHALVVASSRGFIDLVDTLVKCEVDPNATARVLLQSSKPPLHANVNCNALVAAIVSRQISVVKLLLQVGARTDIKVGLGAWSWDTATGEEFRVGAGLAEPYRVTWCAVEYFESSGAILRMLVHHLSPNIPHLGRTIIHHAVLCSNARAVEVLSNCGADMEFPVETTKKIEFRSMHMASRLGFAKVLQQLVNAGCNLDSRTESGDTAIMMCTRFKREDCLRVLVSAGVDLGLVNFAGQCAKSIAGSSRWNLGFQEVIADVVRSGKVVRSSNLKIFSPLRFVVQTNDIDALKKLIHQPNINLDEQDENGFSAAMIAARNDYVDAFKLLIFADADVELQNKYGETAINILEASQKSEAFDKVLLQFALEKGNNSCGDCGSSGGYYALHGAARRGDLDSVRMLLTDGGNNVNINVPDCDGYTPLMLAARGGHGSVCELLISSGAKCDVENERLETALLLARKNCNGNDAERVILNELARMLVVGGARVKKHTREGKGRPHRKTLKMVAAVGVLRWGKSSKRNVICRGAEVGPSSAFRWNRRKKFDGEEPGVFRVVTTKNKEIHFVCEDGVEMAHLWVRGIKLVTRGAIFGMKVGSG